VNTEAMREPIETLLVEDNPGDVELAKAGLRRSHLVHHVTIARNGLEALAVLRGEEPFGDAPRPSLILLDLNLPKKNGMDVLAEVKRDPSLKQIRVVVFTSSQAEEDIAQARALEADEYVTKPVELDLYFAALASIGQRHARLIHGGGESVDSGIGFPAG
jgi:two-component system, chemotaxis family, response regulator Rcp1